MPEINHLTLSELSGRITESIRSSFQGMGFWVIADITNHSFRPQKNYHYFELVEKDPGSNHLLAKIAGKAWGNGSERIARFEKITGQAFTDNIHVLVQVSVQYHSVYGLQVDILDIDPNFTLGALARQRQATLDRLLAENAGFIQKSGAEYITKNKRLPLPAVIQRIAVISSRASAGAEDFKHSLLNNPFGYAFLVDDYDTAVQGELHAEQLLATLIAVFQSQKPYDVVVITRGGGAQTDFLIFDNYKIGRAIARFPIPVITGIGHQKNESIADLMAHTQTKTPTKAAELIIAHNKQFEDNMILLRHQIVIKSQQLFSRHARALASLNGMVANHARNLLTRNKDALNRLQQATTETSRRVMFKNKSRLVNIASQLLTVPRIILYNRFNDLRQIRRQVGSSQGQYLKNQAGYLNHYGAMIRLMAPDNILKKGFALIKVNKKITSDPDAVVVGQDVDIILSGTQIRSTVKQKSKYDGSDFNL